MPQPEHLGLQRPNGYFRARRRQQAGERYQQQLVGSWQKEGRQENFSLQACLYIIPVDFLDEVHSPGTPYLYGFRNIGDNRDDPTHHLISPGWQ